MEEENDKSTTEISSPGLSFPGSSENGADVAGIKNGEEAAKEAPKTDQILNTKDPPEKRKRGRPRKHPKPEDTKEGDGGKDVEKRKRGRPRKHPKPEDNGDRSGVSKKKRGRPRKHPELEEAKDSNGEKQPKRKRGRPRKHPQPEGVGRCGGENGNEPKKGQRGRPRKHSNLPGGKAENENVQVVEKNGEKSERNGDESKEKGESQSSSDATLKKSVETIV